jgi:multidrug efflux pump subunit AcrB
MTITLAAVFAPIGFVSGLTGALFKEFAFTLAGAVLVSGVIALTLSPMMCSRLLKAHNGSSGGRFTRFLDRMFAGLKRRYKRRLHGTLNYRPVTLLVLVGVIAAIGLMYMTTQKELAPEEDQGILFTLVKTPQYGQSRLSRERHPAALQGLQHGSRGRTTCSPSTAWATCIRALPASCSKP